TERHSPAQGGGVVDADAAMDLVVQADFAVGLIGVAGELDTIHAQVGVPPAGPVGVFGVDLWQGDERPAVARPADQLRQFADARVVSEDRSPRAELRPHVPESTRYVPVAPRPLPEAGRINLQLNEMTYGLQSIAEKETRPFERAEQVTDHREAA